MNVSKSLVLDANILIRAVLGQKVRKLLEQHAGAVSFCTPATCIAEAEHYIPLLLEKHGKDPQKALELLSAISAFCL